jgi:RNA polymerase sigma-70 factor (ECF subfamily)
MDEDLDLIDRAVADDREAFDELVRKHQKPLYSLLYRMVSNHEDASDILQKTFVKAFVNLRTFERRSTFKTWLYQIAINLAKNVYRDRARFTQVSIDDVVLRRNSRTVEALIRSEERQQLRNALVDLPEKQRITVLLRVQEEKKFEEIAAVMGCTVGTAKANFHHAMKKLKARLNSGPDDANAHEEARS